MKTNYSELRCKKAVNYDDTNGKRKLYIDYSRNDEIVTTKEVETVEKEPVEWFGWGCVVAMIIFAWDKGLVYIKG